MPLVEKMAGIGVLETEYLKQEKLILPFPGLKKAASFEENMLQTYDLFFRKPLPAGVYEDYCKDHPEAHEAVTDEPMRSCMKWVNGAGNNETAFCSPNSKLLKKNLQKRGQDYIIPPVETLMGMMPPFTEEEVRAYFLHISPVWARLFELFSDRRRHFQDRKTLRDAFRPKDRSRQTAFDHALSLAKLQVPPSKRLQLNVNRENPAVKFYLHIGMHIASQGDFPFGGGYFMNDYIMEYEV